MLLYAALGFVGGVAVAGWLFELYLRTRENHPTVLRPWAEPDRKE